MKKDVTQQDETMTTNVVEATTAEGIEPALKKEKPKFFTTGNMAVMAILTAISFILYEFVKFPMPFIFPSWLKIQISDLPALLGGFALGPVAGCIIIVVKCCLSMTMTATMCVGELADILVGVAFVLPASLIYKRNKSRKGALIGLSVGSAIAVVMSLLANWLMLIPFYATFQFGGESNDYETGMKVLVSFTEALYPWVNRKNFYVNYILIGVLPFNLLRCILCAVITYFTYKPLSKALHWEIKTKKQKMAEQAANAIAEESIDQPIDDTVDTNVEQPQNEQ